ncbi:Ldh family oxidoreductase [Poseidonocella sp. HB161398]|uniref:Ldh family oxidoreductase n=1 Tax=Poseidonocella sp. HB161398 TaxID=2320855 RepID=UPI001108E934|nr:Ldh family oxidoreductase [Poseidonocella sp. HB161398]
MQDYVVKNLLQVQDITETVMSAQGFSEAQAAAIARNVTAAERDECRHHGLFRVAFYINTLRAGQASGTCMPELSDLASSVLRVDGKYGFSPLPLEIGHKALADRAREHGIAALSVNNAHNVAALWPEVERLAEEGLCALAFVAAAPYVAPAGGNRPLFGTNPMAFSWPRPGGLPPVVFDQASSASARGEIQIRLRDGKSLPDGWAIDVHGQPTNDPQEALQGAQLPFGGVKGSSIAMMVELLAGPLLGDLLSFEAGEKDKAKTGAPCGGELIICMDPAHFVPGKDREAQLRHSERLFRKILDQEGTRLPSSRRYEARRRTENEGVRIPKVLYDNLMLLREGGYTTERQTYEGDHIAS